MEYIVINNQYLVINKHSQQESGRDKVLDR